MGDLMTSLKAKLAGALVMLIGLCSALYGQTSTGEVNGTVTDPAGAAVATAAVKLINQATRIETQTVPNQSGHFIFVNVRPGNYILRIEGQGFKTTQTSVFDVGVNQTVTHDLVLTVGDVSQTVEVSDNSAELVQRSTAELGTVIQERAVQDLPLNGRNFTQLLTLTPGVTPVSTAQNRNVGCCEGNVGIPNSGFSDASFHGQGNRSKLYFYDGIINTNVRGPTYIVIPNIDAVQEFKVVGHDAKADFGGAAGGVVNMVSKSGGNDLHGSAFEYVRNNFFDARNAITDVDKRGPAAFHQNQFGGVVTGPIIKNRTFFSASYDGWRYSQASQNLAYVPTAAEINGDFSSYTFVSRAAGGFLYNPFSTRQVGTGTTADPFRLVRDQFRCDAGGNPLPVNAQRQQDQTTGVACNKIPQALISAPMQQFFRAYAANPNYSVAGERRNFIQNRATINNSNSFQGRIDHRFRESDNIFFRYTEHRVSVFNPIGNVGSTEGGSQGRNYGGGWSHVFNPNLILDVRAGYAGRPGVDAGQQNAHPAGTDPMNQFGFKDIDKYGGMLVTLNTGEWTNGGNNSFGTRGAAPRENPSWSLTPNLIWLKGNHNIKTGFWYIEAKRIQENTFQTFTFADDQTASPTAASTTGLSLASALLGFPSSFQGQLPITNGGPVRFKYASWAAYVQDEWKLTPKLTLNFGLRYDYLTQPQTLDGRLWNALDLPNQRWIIGADEMPPLCSVAGKSPCIPDAFRNDPNFGNVVVAGKRFFAPGPVKDNWGPRFGIAWAFSPKMVVRAGYGLYWDALPARSQYAQNDLELAVWPGTTAFGGSVNTAADFRTGGQRLITDIQGNFPTPLPTTTPWTITTNTFGDDPNLKDAYSSQWHVEVQRELTSNMMVSVAYVGSKNGRLPYTGFANAARQASPANTPADVVNRLRPMPWVSANINYTQSIGTSSYNALQAKVERRFAAGLHSLLSYTWGKSIDISSGYFNVENGAGGGSTVQNYYDQSTARGVSGYDITHFLSWATVYELPAGRGKRWLRSGPASWLLGNWQLNYIMQVRSGQPYNLQVNGDIANLRGLSTQPVGTYGRPNMIADPFVAGPVAANPDPLCQRTISQGGRAADRVRTSDTWFNACAFTTPSGSFGNLGRDAFRGQVVFNMDTSMFKNIRLPREGWNLQLRFEAFNVFNVQNYDVPGGVNSSGGSGANISIANAGRIAGLASGTTPRQLQFGLRFLF